MMHLRDRFVGEGMHFAVCVSHYSFVHFHRHFFSFVVGRRNVGLESHFGEGRRQAPLLFIESAPFRLRRVTGRFGMDAASLSKTILLSGRVDYN